MSGPFQAGDRVRVVGTAYLAGGGQLPLGAEYTVVRGDEKITTIEYEPGQREGWSNSRFSLVSKVPAPVYHYCRDRVLSNSTFDTEEAAAQAGLSRSGVGETFTTVEVRVLRKYRTDKTITAVPL